MRGLRLAGGSLPALMFTLASLAPILVLVGRDRFAMTAREVRYLFGLMGLVVVVLHATAIGWLTSSKPASSSSHSRLTIDSPTPSPP